MSIPRRAVSAVFWADGKTMGATRQYTAEVMHRYELNPGEEWIADIVAQEIERVGREDSFPCFNMEGNGPICSHCHSIFCECAKYAEAAQASRLIEEAERARSGAATPEVSQ